ncbi:MAG: hypothetical protein IPI31_19305 [Bacteroidetes bacterium]|nr:hypothetical protein [Bacteroidota bacterium]
MARRKIGIIGGILAVVIFITVYLLFFNKRNETVLNGMPQDVICFFDVKKTDAFTVLLNNEVAMQELMQTQLFGNLKNDLELFNKICGTKAELLSDIQNKNFLTGAFASGDNNVQYLFLLQLDEASKLNLKQFLPDFDGEQPSVSVHKFERADIYELNYSKSKVAVAFAKVSGVFIFSASSVLVENAILQLKNGDPVTEHAGFKDVYDKMNKKADYSFYLNTDQLGNYLSLFSTNDKYASIMQLSRFVSWMGFEFEFGEAGLNITGYAASKNDESDLLLSKYTGEFSVDMNVSVPANTVVLYRLNAEHLTENIASSFTDENQNRDYFDHWMPWMTNNILFGISESLDQNFMKRSFLIIPASDRVLAENKLKSAVVSDTLRYRGHVIMEMAASNILTGIAGAKFPEICYTAWNNNDLVVAFELLQLKNMFDAIENGETLIADSDYNEFKKHVSASFNNSIYLNLSKSEQVISSFVSDKHIDSIEKNFNLLQKFPRLELQFSNNKNIYLLNGFISYNAAPQRRNGVLWKLQVDHPIESGPFTVYNQLNKQKSIVVQDTAHQLYLISASGDVLWKQKLPNKITGKIHEVDFYGNEKSQILFNTSDAIYLLDMNGNAVEGFPITLTAKITNPLTVLMNTKNDYRMFVACDNDNIYGFFKDGKPIPGWNPQRNTGDVTSPLFEMTSDKLNLIVFINAKGIQFRKEGGNSVRSIPVKNNIIATSTNTKTKYFMDAVGNIILADGNLNTKTIAAPDNFISGNFALVNGDDTTDILFLEDTYLKAKNLQGKSLFVAEIDSVYNHIVSFNFNEQSYFGVVSASNSLLLFDENGKITEGFPIVASADFLIDDLTRNGDKMLVTCVDNAVITYRIK